MNEMVTKENINYITSSICDVFYSAARETFGLRKKPTRKVVTNSKPWFNGNCRRARRNFHLAKRIYNNNKSTEKKDNLNQMSKAYKKTMDNSIKKHRNDITKKLSDLHSKNPKDYWKILNVSNKNSKCAVDVDAVYSFLKNINENVIFDSNQCNIDDDEKVVNNFSDEILDSLNCEIKDEEILEAVKRLKNNKAGGFDKY